MRECLKPILNRCELLLGICEGLLLFYAKLTLLAAGARSASVIICAIIRGDRAITVLPAEAIARVFVSDRAAHRSLAAWTLVRVHLFDFETNLGLSELLLLLLPLGRLKFFLGHNGFLLAIPGGLLKLFERFLAIKSRYSDLSLMFVRVIRLINC